MWYRYSISLVQLSIKASSKIWLKGILDTLENYGHNQKEYTEVSDNTIVVFKKSAL